MITSLRRLGPEAAKTAAALSAQADELQTLGVASNEQIQSTQALLAEMGVAADQIDQATRAAANLSLAFGISLESAARNVGRTVGGFAGELGELIPELKGLTAEALQAGEGIDLLSEKFAGNIEANARTTGASISRLNEALADTTKIVGNATGQGAAGGINNLAFSIERLNAAITGSKAEGFFSRLTSKLANMAALFVATTEGILEYNGLLERSADQADTTSATFERLAASTDRYGQETRQSAQEIQAYIDKMRGLETVTEEVDTNKRALIESAEGYTAAQVDLIAQTDTLTRSLDRAARAASDLNTATGGTLTARDRRNQADVDAALRAGRTPFQGGTRIRTADGSGSRLLR